MAHLGARETDRLVPLLQCINVMFWLVPNVYILVHPCSWIGNTLVDTCTYIRWTCWNLASPSTKDMRL